MLVGSFKFATMEYLVQFATVLFGTPLQIQIQQLLVVSWEYLMVKRKINIYITYYTYTASTVTPSSSNTIVTAVDVTDVGPITLDGLYCQGTEASLADCQFNPYGVHDCTHDQDIVLFCEGIYHTIHLLIQYT